MSHIFPVFPSYRFDVIICLKATIHTAINLRIESCVFLFPLISIRDEDEEAFSYICGMCEEDRCCPFLGPPISMRSTDKRKILFTGAYDVNSFTKFADIMSLDVVTMKWESWYVLSLQFSI